MMRTFLSLYFQLFHLFIAALLECNAQPGKLCKHVQTLDMAYVQGHSVSITCLTTTHPLQSVTVKLSRVNPNKVLLPYSEPSPASEPQRWSVREDAGNVKLRLVDVRSSDKGLYECQVYKGSDCLNEIRFDLTVTKCKRLDSVYAKPLSSVLLPCADRPLPDTTDRVTWEVISGHQSTQIDKYSHNFKPSDSTEKHPDPLYMRAKPQKNGSLLIMKATHIDELWYRCIVNEETCYEMKLVMKKTAGSGVMMTESPASQTEDGTDTRAFLLAVVTASAVFLCVFISLIICLILNFKKQRRKINSQAQFKCLTSVEYSAASEAVYVNRQQLLKPDKTQQYK